MKSLLGATLFAVSAAQGSDRDQIYRDYQICVSTDNADLAYCYNTYLSGRTFTTGGEVVDPENDSVVEDPVNGEPTGRVIHDQGDETYRRTFEEVFPFATVDFFKTDSRSTGVGPDLGVGQVVIPGDTTSHAFAEPNTCVDPCGEMKMKIRDLRDQVEFLEWRNFQAEELYATIAYRYNAGTL